MARGEGNQSAMSHPKQVDIGQHAYNGASHSRSLQVLPTSNQSKYKVNASSQLSAGGLIDKAQGLCAHPDFWSVPRCLCWGCHRKKFLGCNSRDNYTLRSAAVIWRGSGGLMMSKTSSLTSSIVSSGYWPQASHILWIAFRKWYKSTYV